MVSSVTSIINRAADYIGSETVIDASTTNTENAAVYERNYPFSRDVVLQLHQWNSATALSVLPKKSDNPAFGFSYQYELPSDFIRIVSLNNHGVGGGSSPLTRQNSNSSQLIYRVFGKQIHTDAEAPLELLYVSNAVDVSQFDAGLADLIALRLAADMYYAITKELDGGANSLEKRFSIKLEDLKTLHAQQGVYPEPNIEDFTSARW